MVTEAKKHLLSVMFLGEPSPKVLYVGLSAETKLPPQNLTEATIREPTRREGYHRQRLSPSDWNLKDDGSIVSRPVSFLNEGREMWSPIHAAFVATTEDNSGVMLSWALLDRPRMLQPGDELVFPITIRF